MGPFRGELRWLSNFWPALVVLDDVVYPTVEHAYQAAKTDDWVEREAIRSCQTPGDAKRFAKHLPLPPDWEFRKVYVMRGLLEQKFQHPELAEKLLATGDAEIIEVNHWGDTFWGQCNGEGENHLGRMLMDIRNTLRKER